MFCIFIYMKKILITGANGHLGTATVKKFLDNNYRVIAVARSGSELGFAHHRKNFELHELDLADENACLFFAKEALNMYGTIEGALFLAGGFAMDNVENTSVGALQKMIALNFETSFNLSRPFFQHMVQAGYGRIVFVGAKAVLQPETGGQSLAYTLSKSLLFTYASLLNAQAKGTNVTASVVIPSIIDTAPNRAAMPQANQDNWVSSGQIADVLEFICSDAGAALREPIFKVYNNA